MAWVFPSFRCQTHGRCNGRPAKDRVGFVVGTLKKHTCRKLQERYKFLGRGCWDRRGIWSKGFLATMVGGDEDILRRDVAMHGQEDAGLAQLEF